MDPLSISTACVSLIATLGRILPQIGSFVSDVRDARRDMDAVYRELNSLLRSLENLRDDSIKVEYPEGSRRTLITVLGNCNHVTKEIEALLNKITSGNIGRRMQWTMYGQDDMNKLRSRLEAHKSAINIALDMVSIQLISAVKDDTKTIKQNTAQISEIRQDTADLLQQLASLRLQIAELERHDGGQGIILQRFSDESTSYAETVTNGEDLDELSEDGNEDDSSEDSQHALVTPKKRLNSPNTPMRGLSAFMFFANDEREKIRMENPALSFGMCLDFCDPGLTNSLSSQRGKILGERWNALSESQREPYNKKAAADKKRYEDEKAKYNLRNEGVEGELEDDVVVTMDGLMRDEVVPQHEKEKHSDTKVEKAQLAHRLAGAIELSGNGRFMPG
jgi:hypothetical protein